jgi:hypothetical protein
MSTIDFTVMKNTFLLMALAIATPVFGALPMAPAQVCVDDNCVAAPAPVISRLSKKWHPGSYLKTQGTPTVSGYQQSITSQIGKTTESELIRGALIAYAWGTLEPSNGRYDWSPVYEHLNWLQAHGKYLIVDLTYKNFSTTGIGSLVPIDLRGSVVAGTSSNAAYIASLWRQSEMDRFIRFLRAFAAEFDGHAALELVRTSETSPSFQGGAPGDYSAEVYAVQLKRMYSAMSSAFVRTNVTAAVNSLNDNAAGLIETAYQQGMGRSSPDAMDDNGARIFRGEQVSGQGPTIRDYRALMPHETVASQPVLEGKDGTRLPSEILSWAASNKVTHVAWVATLSGARSWDAILSAINQNGSSLWASCPKNYKGCELQ